ncbi:MAG: hypothetical protein J2P36_24795 [Ktedonobacteraceae bacterium]|nr:hypothetical protein [Ktedonobacteraceae bacterium]
MASEEARHALTAEILELGEELFELALQRSASDEQPENADAESLRTASAEFFAALRLLLAHT